MEGGISGGRMRKRGRDSLRGERELLGSSTE